MLLVKLMKAAHAEKIHHIAIAGGVSANSELRNRLMLAAKEKNWFTYIPDFQYCTDNAGMIAISGHMFI